MIAMRSVITVAVVFAGTTSLLADDDQGIAFFEKKIRPVLVKHCYECHSQESKTVRGGLLLDSRAGLLRGGDSGPALVPKKRSESLLIDALKYESFEMPPNGRLPDAVIADFEKWIEIGAPDPRHDPRPAVDHSGIDFEAARQFWAFQPPRKSAPPAVKNADWPATDIDRFILARLEREQLRPVADADRRALLRRVTFDLTGLPPSPEDIAAFLANESEDAWPAVVDRLLASPHFGEHWGRHWLDVARYADSNGGDINLTFRNAWRYRDYVIAAFNNDQPFDQMIREQLAGDLLPFESVEQQARQFIASGFLVVGPKMLSERDKEKLYMDVVDEQLDSIGRTFLGLTLGCARCHDHKFDPIPTQDYYALAGILRSTVTVEGIRMNNVNVSGWIERPLPVPPEQEQALIAHEANVKRLTDEIAAAKAALSRLQKQTTFSRESLLGIVVDDSEAKLVGDWKPSTYVPRFVGKGYVHDNKEGKGEKSITFTPKLSEAGEYEVRISYAGGNGRDTKVPVNIRHSGGETLVEVNQFNLPAVGGLFQPLGRFPFEPGESGSVTIATTGTVEYVIADAAQFIPVKLLESEESAAMDAALKTQAEVTQQTEKAKQLEGQLQALQKNAPPRPMAMAARDREEPADCQVCIRGEPHNRGRTAPRGFLTVTQTGNEPEIPPGQSGRRELAEWIASPENPLTARVIVNRIWHHLFGSGLVRTVDNFGKLGERPSHPELLDRLAVEFIEDGWSIKRAVRKIVLSRVYRLSANDDVLPSDAGRAVEFRDPQRVDPENRLLWRHSRRRLEAESIRDAILAAAGTLDRTAGGPSVDGLGEQAIANNPNDQTGQVALEANTRRSVYLPLVRNDLPDFLTIFDFADPDVVTGRRSMTTVPAQALLMMNSNFVRRQANAIAERVLAEESADTEARVTAVYTRTLGRPPTGGELARATSYITGFSAVEAADDRETQSPELPAWGSFCHALLASTEFRFVE